MPDYAVRTTFTARDNVSDSFDRMGRAAGRFANTSNRAFNQSGRSAQRFGDRTSTAFRNSTKEGYKFMTIVKGILAANAIRGGIGLIGSAVQNASTSFVDFDDTMVRAAVKFDDIGVSARDAANGYKFLRAETASLKKETLEMIKGTPFTPTDAAKAIDSLAASGFLRRGGAMAGARASMSVATATGEDLPSVTSNLMGMMGSFNLRDKNNPAKEMANFKRLGDVMTLAANLSNVSIMDLKETMEQIGPVSGMMGTNLEEAAAMAAILGNASIKGTEGATALKNIMLSLADPMKSKEIGLNIGGLVDKKTGEMKAVSRIVTETYQTLSGIFKGPDARLKIAGIMNHLFGLRGVAGAKTLADSIAEITAAQEKLNKAGGTSEQQAAAVAALSMKIKIAEVYNAALTKTFQIFESFNQGGQKGMEGIISRIEKFDAKPLIDGLHKITGLMTTLYRVVEPLFPYIPAMAKAFIAWKVYELGSNLYRVVSAIGLIGEALTVGLGPVGAMTTALQALVGTITPVKALLIPLIAAYATSQAMKENGWGDNRSADDLVAESRKGQAPNVFTEAAKNARAGSWQGQLNISGAPAGSTVTSKSTGAPGMSMQLLGVNP